MANTEHLAQLKQGFVNVLARARHALASGAAYVYAWRETWIAEWQVEEAIRRTRQQITARLRFTSWQEVARRYLPLLVGLGVLLLLFALWKLPQWYAASRDKLTDSKDIAKLESDTRTTMVQAVGGLALLAGLLFTWRNLRMTEQNSRQTLDLSRKGQINDRFIKAIEQLGAVDQEGRKKLEVRLGGIYALEQIAKDSPDDHHWPIMEILTAYIREHAPIHVRQPLQEGAPPHDTSLSTTVESGSKLATDIQALLTVLGRRAWTYGKGEDQRLDLAYTDLRGAQLGGGVHLEGAFLRGAQLQGTFLVVAELQGADLRGAQLQEAVLGGAHLERANLVGAQLQEAVLEEAWLQGVRGLTVEQLSTVKTLYQTRLDPPLLEQIQQQYPQLLEKPQE
jgi:hypothetical protein